MVPSNVFVSRSVSIAAVTVGSRWGCWLAGSLAVGAQQAPVREPAHQLVTLAEDRNAVVVGAAEGQHGVLERVVGSQLRRRTGERCRRRCVLDAVADRPLEVDRGDHTQQRALSVDDRERVRAFGREPLDEHVATADPVSRSVAV